MNGLVSGGVVRFRGLGGWVGWFCWGFCWWGSVCGNGHSYCYGEAEDEVGGEPEVEEVFGFHQYSIQMSLPELLVP